MPLTQKKKILLNEESMPSLERVSLLKRQVRCQEEGEVTSVVTVGLSGATH